MPSKPPDIDKMQALGLASTSQDGGTLLSETRSGWATGIWDHLDSLTAPQVAEDGDRDKIALLIATAAMQTGATARAKEFLTLSLKWGCPQEAVNRLLVASMELSLARSYVAAGALDTAKGMYLNSLEHIFGQQEAKRLTQIHLVSDLAKYGMFDDATNEVVVGHSKLHTASNPTDYKARSTIIDTQIELINHNLALDKQRRIDSQLAETNPSPSNQLGRLSQKSTSQLGQDLWVLAQTNYRRGGYFVEFGATDGVLLSNTLLLEREFGWNGICAEPNPSFFRQLCQNRACQVSEACVGPISDETVDFILADEYGGIESYVGKHAHQEKIAAFKAEGNRVSLTTTSLEDLLLQYNAPKNIDYLSIDTEGSEFEILRNFPFTEWTITLITVEHNFEPQREEIFQLLTSFGYQRTEKRMG